MRRLIALLAVVLLALAAASVGRAGEPHAVQVKGVDVSVPATLNTFMTAACGFPVYHQAEGFRNTTLFYDENGVLVRQIDIYPTLRWWLSAPQFGTTWSWGAAAEMTEITYAEGAAIGAPVTVKLVGRQGKNEGFQPDAGLRIYSGHVVAYDGDVPLWDGIYTADLLRITGVWGSDQSAALTAAECAGLSGS